MQVPFGSGCPGDTGGAARAGGGWSGLSHAVSVASGPISALSVMATDWVVAGRKVAVSVHQYLPRVVANAPSY
jgi:hypothetical protein